MTLGSRRLENPLTALAAIATLAATATATAASRTTPAAIASTTAPSAGARANSASGATTAPRLTAVTSTQPAAHDPYATGGAAADPGDEVCTCTASYSNGSSELVSECSRSECPDPERYVDCRNAASTGVMPIEGCVLLESCDCTCTTREPRSGERYGDDVGLSGVPNLWQFDYRCGAFGENAVGCGPVAASMITYWWAQQGYDGLVHGLTSGGNTPASAEHDWKAMVRTFRDDYLNGGICISGQYATLQTTLRSGIKEYFEDSGYAADVDHYKVCSDCNRNQPEEIDPGRALGIIEGELRYGRPVIIGFNVGRATERTRELAEDGYVYEVYSGELSNGGDGWIDHYAVVTGYERIDGEDVLIMNVGWDHTDEGDAWVDIPFLWKPAGRWLHVYTVDVEDAPDGFDWCALDRGIDDTFLASAELDASYADPDAGPETVLAGTRCGIVRDVTEYEYYPTWSGTSFECDPFAELEHDLEQALDHTPGTLGESANGNPRGNPEDHDLILDHIPPP